MFKGAIKLEAIKSEDSAKITNKIVNFFIFITVVSLIYHFTFNEKKPTEEVLPKKNEVEMNSDTSMNETEKVEKPDETQISQITKNEEEISLSVLLSYPKSMIGSEIYINDRFYSLADNRTKRFSLAKSSIPYEIRLENDFSFCLKKTVVDRENQQISFISTDCHKK